MSSSPSYGEIYTRLLEGRAFIVLLRFALIGPAIFKSLSRLSAETNEVVSAVTFGNDVWKMSSAFYPITDWRDGELLWRFLFAFFSSNDHLFSEHWILDCCDELYWQRLLTFIYSY